MPGLVMPNYDYLTNELAQNSSRRKQRCPRPVKLKRGRGRPKKSETTTNGTPGKRSMAKRKRVLTKEVALEDVEDDAEEEEPEPSDEKGDPEFVVIIEIVRDIVGI